MASKKTLWRLAAAAVAALLLTACGSTGDEIKQPSAVQGTSSTVSIGGNTAEVTLTETEIYNAGGITVTATKLNRGMFGPSISVTASNDSGRNVVITTQRLSVNGYMLSTSSLYCEVAAGKKANDELSLMSTDLDQAGIETIGEVEFYLNISDSDSYETIAESGLITLKTSASGTFPQSADDSGELVYDKGGIRVVCKGLKQDTVWDGTVVFYVENNTSQPVTVYAENVSVNGYMVDVSLWTDLRAGTKAIDGMYLMDLNSLELTGIDAVESIEFSLRMVNGDDWQEIDTTDPITLNF